MTAFTLSQVKPSIFLLEFQEQYDLCMFFLRYQEYYESPSPQFRGKSFQILDFMKWYSLEFGKGAFTYPKNWGGFNIPSYVVKQVVDLGIPDKNLYDYEMWEVYKQCREQVGDKFYLIGVSKSKKKSESKGKDYLDHEIAHGFFYINDQYREEMTQLVEEMPTELVMAMRNFLKKLGYTPEVYTDEIQAYMSTTEDFADYKYLTSRNTKKLMKARKPFERVLRKYMKEGT